jgi:hypothetical protein
MTLPRSIRPGAEVRPLISFENIFASRQGADALDLDIVCARLLFVGEL